MTMFSGSSLAGTCVWGAHAPSRAGDGALAIANFITGKRLFRRGRRRNAARQRAAGLSNQHARARALPSISSRFNPIIARCAE